MLEVDELVGVLGSHPGHANVQAMLDQIQGNTSARTVEPEIKAYPDVVYHNYQALGLSLQCECGSACLPISCSN